MPLQLRPKDSSDQRMYAPNRDIAYCFPELVRAALHGLTETQIDVWFGKMLEDNGATCDDMIKLLEVAAKSVELFAADDTTTASDALIKAGFYNLQPCVQAAFFCKLGQALMGAAFRGMRDTLPMGAEPPVSIKELGEEAIKLQKILEDKACQKC